MSRKGECMCPPPTVFPRPIPLNTLGLTLKPMVNLDPFPWRRSTTDQGSPAPCS